MKSKSIAIQPLECVSANDFSIGNVFRYFGLCGTFKYLEDSNYIRRDVAVDLMINIDGLPLFKSARTSIWPILIIMKSAHCSYKNPLPIGLFYGDGKPPVDEFTWPKVEELKC